MAADDDLWNFVSAAFAQVSSIVASSSSSSSSNTIYFDMPEEINPFTILSTIDFVTASDMIDSVRSLPCLANRWLYIIGRQINTGCGRLAFHMCMCAVCRGTNSCGNI